jgi:hypothetical protein
MFGLNYKSKRSFMLFAILVLSGLNQSLHMACCRLNTGDILVTDQDAGTSNRGILFLINPLTGSREILSDFGVGDNQGYNAWGVAIESYDEILVVDPDAGTGNKGALFRVDSSTGQRIILSDFGQGDNQGFTPIGVTVEASGKILVVDSDAGAVFRGMLFRVDPSTGERTVLSDFNVGDNQGSDPCGVSVEASGQILVIDRNGGSGGRGALFRINPVTGARVILSDFGSGENMGKEPYGVAVEASGQILVIDQDAGTGDRVLFSG